MIRTFKDLIVYEKAFPRIEKFSLTDQIRRSSRSVCVNIGKAWRNTRYPAHFVSKLTEADAEVTETIIWLDFSVTCEYLHTDVHREVAAQYNEIARSLAQ